MLLPLPGSAEALWEGFRSKLRSQIRKAEKNNLAFVWGEKKTVRPSTRSFPETCWNQYPMVYWLPQRLPFLHIGASIFSPEFERKRLLPFQAGIGSMMLRRLVEINKRRKAWAKILQERLEKSRGIFIQPVAGAEPVYLRLPVLYGAGAPGERPDLGIVRSYPLPLDEVPGLQPHLVSPLRYPVAKELAEGILTLPTHEFVTNRDIEAIREAAEGW